MREKPGEVMVHPGHPNIQIQSWISGKNVQICSKPPRGYRAAQKKHLGDGDYAILPQNYPIININ